MKSKRPILFVLLLFVMAGCAGQGKQFRPVTIVEVEEVAAGSIEESLSPEDNVPLVIEWEDREIFRPGLIAEEQAVLDDLEGASIYHIKLDIPDDLEVLQGHLEVQYTNREDTDLEQVYFRLYPNVSGGKIMVSNVLVDGKTVTASEQFGKSALRVPLPEPLGVGETVLISMDFADDLPREMGGNYGLFGFFDNVMVLDEFYPVIPAYDEEGWNVEVPPPAGDWTHFDASFYVVEVTAPADLVLAASGQEVTRTEEDDRQVVTLAAGPARDFYIAGSTDFIKVSQQVGETTVNSYALSHWPDGAALALKIASDALQVFSTRFGTYPYAEFDVVSTPMLALGIEYPGITGITLQEYDLEGTMYGTPVRVMLETTVVHEVGHQWFYNAVGNDQVDEPWLDEAVVQYITSLYYVDLYNESAAESYRQGGWYGRWDRVDRADVPIGLPSADYEEGYYVPAVYGRGPVFMQTLAEEMGQETFDAFLREYYQAHKWSIAQGGDFRRMAEEQCDCDLEQLFVDWVYAK
ncbi:MAG: M1 family metallopeptidase [Anaerolineaceae bacterium]|nr:M1 family metallopeptidase [Anaerolineaceae bacterium]